MKPTTILHAAILSAITTLAHPLNQPDHHPHPHPQPNPAIHPRTLPAYGSPDEVSASAVYYDKNWAGAVQTGTGYKSVTGTITVPSVKLPAGANPEVLHAVSAWVGIDGEFACRNTILQAGVDMYVNQSVVEYWAWYEWFPQHSTYLPAFAISEGDTITLTVTATSLNAATVSIVNHRTGQTETATLADQTPPLCGFNAEWIVEDFWDSDGVPLVDFGSITFSNATYTTELGGRGGVEGAKMDGVKDAIDGPVVVDCGKVGGDGLTCFYRGGRRA